MDLKETFTRKIGPLPMWVWAVGAGAGIGLYIRHRRAVQAASASAPSTSSTTDVASPPMDALASGIPSDFAGGGSYSGPSSSDLADAVAAGLATWQAQQPPVTAADPTAPAVPPAAAVPIAVTVQAAPSELHGGGPPAPVRRNVQIRRPAPVPAGTSPDRANTGVVHNGVDEGTLNAAMAITGRAGYPRVERSTMAERMRQHPDWGPYTLAHGGQVRGHSTRF